MSEVQTSGQPDQVPVESQDVKKDGVSYDSFQKVLKEKKTFQEKFEAMQAKLDAIENEKLEKEGKVQELLQKQREETKKYEDSYKGLKAQLAKNAIQQALRQEAAKHGVLDVSDLETALEIDSISIDTETNQVSQEDVKKFVEGMKGKKPHWFKKDAKPNNDMNASNQPNQGSKDLSSLTDEQLRELLKQTL